MGWCVRLSPALLVHVNLLLCMVGGAGLATAARLKWDPSTYVVVRELLPAEYRAAAVVLTAAAVALAVLAHLAAAALALRAAAPRAARAMLYTYACVMAAATAGEAAWVTWTAVQVAAWLHSERARAVLDLLELNEHLRPLLAFLGRYHHLPDRINTFMEEAEADAPCNLYVGAAALALTGLLQLAAVLLALLSAAGGGRRPPPTHSMSCSISSTDNEAAPLKTAYKNGRLVIL